MGCFCCSRSGQRPHHAWPRRRFRSSEGSESVWSDGSCRQRLAMDRHIYRRPHPRGYSTRRQLLSAAGFHLVFPAGVQFARAWQVVDDGPKHGSFGSAGFPLRPGCTVALRPLPCRGSILSQIPRLYAGNGQLWQRIELRGTGFGPNRTQIVAIFIGTQPQRPYVTAQRSKLVLERSPKTPTPSIHTPFSSARPLKSHLDTFVVDVPPRTVLLDPGETLGKGQCKVELRRYFKFEKFVYVAPFPTILTGATPSEKDRASS